jgi:hypothetical protein
MALPDAPVTVTHKGRLGSPVMTVPLQRAAVAVTVTAPSERSQTSIPVHKWSRHQIGPWPVNEGCILKFIQIKPEQTQRNDKGRFEWLRDSVLKALSFKGKHNQKVDMADRRCIKRADIYF